MGNKQEWGRSLPMNRCGRFHSLGLFPPYSKIPLANVHTQQIQTNHSCQDQGQVKRDLRSRPAQHRLRRWKARSLLPPDVAALESFRSALEICTMNNRFEKAALWYSECPALLHPASWEAKLPSVPSKGWGCFQWSLRLTPWRQTFLWDNCQQVRYWEKQTSSRLEKLETKQMWLFPAD